MIYAQRPDATLCKPYEEWNTEQYRRYVKRGSKGIALFVMNQDKPYLRYVFDVSDTGVRRSSPALSTWKVTTRTVRILWRRWSVFFRFRQKEYWKISLKISQCNRLLNIGQIIKSQSSTSLRTASWRSMMNITSK